MDTRRLLGGVLGGICLLLGFLAIVLFFVGRPLAAGGMSVGALGLGGLALSLLRRPL